MGSQVNTPVGKRKRKGWPISPEPVSLGEVLETVVEE